MTSPPHTTLETEPLIERLRRATIGRYDIYAELGSGGMASVFLALDLALDRKVAIKVLAPNLASAPDNVTRFRREAKVAAALDHPNIIGILAVGEDSSLAFFVMKYVEGSTLDSVIAAEGAQSIPFARSVLATTARALHYAHQRGVIHRDVKPANLMLDLEGRLIITDFGIAKMEDAQGLTITGSVIGTPYYMSPEQFNGLPITGATDQYALGVVAYELLTGLQPYRGRTVGEVMRGHLFDPIPSVRSEQPEIPEELDAAVTRMLAKRPEDRFATLEEAARAIEIGGGQDESLVRTQIIELARSGARQRPEIHVPVSPSPAVRPRPLASAGSAATTVVSRPPRRRMTAAVVTLAIALGAVGATAALRPDLLGIGSNTALESTGDTLSAGIPDSSSIVTAPPQGSAPDTAVRTVADPSVTETPTQRAPITPPRRPLAANTATGSAQESKSAPQQVTQQPPSTAPAPAPVEPEPKPQPVTPPAPALGVIKIGSNVPLHRMYVNGVLQPFVRGVRTLRLPAGDVRIRIESRCTPFDTLVTLGAGAEVSLGTRPVVC